MSTTTKIGNDRMRWGPLPVVRRLFSQLGRIGQVDNIILFLMGIFLFSYIWFLVTAYRMVLNYTGTYHSLGGDFAHFYGAALMAARGDILDIYNPPAFRAAMLKLMGTTINYWPYPPTFLVILLPLSLLPYLPALLIWVLLTLGLFLLVVHRIAPKPLTFWITLAFPATFYNIFTGQNGFLSATLLGGGLLLLENYPFTGGILLGLLTYKPHLAVLLPVALISGRQWRALLGAISSALGLVWLSVALFGARVWLLFPKEIPLSMEFLQSAPRPKMVSTFAAVILLKGSPVIAWTLQGLVMLAAVAAVIWGWRLAAPYLRNALLVLSILLFTPHAFYYDLTLLALPLAWIGWQGYNQGWLPGEQIILALGWLLPFLIIFRILGIDLNLPVAPLILLALVILVVRRQYTPGPDQAGV